MTMAQGEPIVRISGLNKFYGNFHVLKDIDLTVDRGEVLVIVGASGSGKSTLIRCVNGLEEYQTGTLEVDSFLMPRAEEREFGEVMGLREIRKGVGMVFQSFNLFPHLTVLQNITLGPMRVRGKTRAEADAQAMALLDRVGLANQAEKYPGALSGGQQ